jgi:hypothetical protein
MKTTSTTTENSLNVIGVRIRELPRQPTEMPTEAVLGQNAVELLVVGVRPTLRGTHLQVNQ